MEGGPLSVIGKALTEAMRTLGPPRTIYSTGKSILALRREKHRQNEETMS